MIEIGSSGSVKRSVRGGFDGVDDRLTTLTRVAGTIGVAGQIASAYWYLLYPLLVVPSPANYAFFVSWFVLVGVAVAWWPRHPVRSFFVPVISVPLVILVLQIGTALLGWAP